METLSTYRKLRTGGANKENYDEDLDIIEKVGKPVMAGEVAEAIGLDKKEVDKIMAKLKKEGKIVSPKVCFWEIKK